METTTKEKIMIDQTPEGWNIIAKGYTESFEKLTDKFALEVIDFVNVKLGDKFIDVAAGTGNLAIRAAKKGAEVLATDFAINMLSRLKERAQEEGLKNIKTKIMDGQNLEVSDNTYDISASCLGLIFFPDIDKGISELHRVIKPGGRSAIVAWNDITKFTLLKLTRKAIMDVLPDFKDSEPRVAERLLGSEALKARMEKAGFKNVEAIISNQYITIESAEKFWLGFTSSAPPLLELFKKIGPQKTEELGKRFVHHMNEEKHDGSPKLEGEVCIGIGWK
ncbi:MAG TPA: class I SAM-dependent methyltransferase [Ignavibacteriaceae bacterium]|nr:class I SAM-dependent methyltransferase [Ignavibacteriaceae bacterium]